MTNKTILITGANGCVGQYLIDWFIKNTRFKLLLMVRNPDKLQNSIKKNKRINLLICDIRDCSKFKGEISESNFLIHTATAWGDPKRAYEVNIKAFEELLSMLDEKNIERILYFSTASILDKKTELMREARIYGTEYIKTKYECYERLKASIFAKKTSVIFPTLVFGGNFDKDDKYPFIQYQTPDSQLTYNADSNNLTSATFTGDLNGTATTATKVDVTTTSNNTCSFRWISM